MPGKQSGSRAGASKLATLGIAWGAVAGVAYLGLLKTGVDVVKKATGWAGPGEFDAGLIKLGSAQAGQANTSLGTVAITALPFAIIAVLGIGLATRLRPTMPALPPLMIAAAVLGLAGTALLFFNRVVKDEKPVEIVAALGTIVAIPVLLRVQRFVRRFYQRAPAIASLLVGALLLAYLFLTNGTSISAIIMREVDIYLALGAFTMVLYSGITLARRGGQQVRRGR